MKTKICTLLVAALFFSSISFAKIFRVGYNGVALAGVDYTSLQDAHDASSAGDTIQIYGSNGTSAAITKQLIIIGFGYNFDANANLQAIGTDAPSQVSLAFGAGSDGTIVSGVTGQFNINDPSGTLISNITFQRCNGSFLFFNNNGPISNIKIISCVVISGQAEGGTNGFALTNLNIDNCILGGFVSLSGTTTTATFVNCVSPFNGLTLDLSNAGVVVKNCLLYYSGLPANINTIYENNFFGEPQPATLPPGSNNRWSQDWGTIFNRLGGTDDSPGIPATVPFDEDYYVLKSGSPAINGGFDAANNPTDAGIYGGEAVYKYKLSGVPAVPAIYKLTAPGTAASANPYNVTISVRSNN